MPASIRAQTKPPRETGGWRDIIAAKNSQQEHQYIPTVAL